MTVHKHGGPSVARLTKPLVDTLIGNAETFRVGVSKHGGAVIVDAGIEHRGSLRTGLLVSEICLGGLGTVAALPAQAGKGARARLSVSTHNPVIACLGSQYAGWDLKSGDFFALGSGPARAQAHLEELYHELGYSDVFDHAVIVLETDQIPPAEVVKTVSDACKVKPENLTIILTPTRSLAGNTQVVARVLEVSLHKAHSVGFPLHKIVDGLAEAPLPPPCPDFITAMGRTNDAILFGGSVQLWVDADDDEAETLAKKLPSNTSSDYGKPFAEIFTFYGDFFKIDPLLFSPAQITVNNLATGRSFSAGMINDDLLNRSFGDA